MRLRDHRVAALFLLLFLVACGGGDAPPSEATTEAAPEVEVEAPATDAGDMETAAGVSPEDQEAILQTGLLGEWRWIGFQGMDDSSIEVDDPSKYTLVFRVDGVRVVADCNRATGSFDLDGSSLSFGPMAMTTMACPGESLGDRFAGYLTGVRSYTIRDGHLFLSLMADGGIMEFRPGGEGA